MEKKNNILTDDEFKSLSKKTVYEIRLSDPSSVLDYLNIDYSRKSSRYIWNVDGRGKRKDNANIYIADDGCWKYHEWKSHSAHENGDIITVLVNHENISVYDARNKAAEILGTRNYVEEELDSRRSESALKRSKSYKEAKKLEHLKRSKELRIIKLQNQKKSDEKKEFKIKVFQQVDGSNSAVTDFLKNRGITNSTIPGLFHIEFETDAGEGKDYKIFTRGIGVISGDVHKIDYNNLDCIKGADVHLFKKWVSPDGKIEIKAKTCGPKDITFIKGSSLNKFAIFESKFDYAAAYSKGVLGNKDEYNVIVTNGAGMHMHVVKKMATVMYKNSKKSEKTLSPSLVLFNQNDSSCLKMMAFVIKKMDIKRFCYLTFDKSEQGLDINDLVEKNIDISKKMTLGTLQDLITVIKSMSKLQDFTTFKNKLEKLSDKRDLEEYKKVVHTVVRLKSTTSSLEKDVASALVNTGNKFKNESSKYAEKFTEMTLHANIELYKWSETLKHALIELEGSPEIRKEKISLIEQLEKHFGHIEEDLNINNSGMKSIIEDIELQAYDLDARLSTLDNYNQRMFGHLKPCNNNEANNNLGLSQDGGVSP